jgi:hypothetical protein
MQIEVRQRSSIPKSLNRTNEPSQAFFSQILETKTEEKGGESFCPYVNFVFVTAETWGSWEPARAVEEGPTEVPPGRLGLGPGPEYRPFVPLYNMQIGFEVRCHITNKNP